MSPILDSPSQAISFEPARGAKGIGGQVSDEADGLIFAADMLPGQPGDLSGEGKADVFRCDGAAFERTAFGNASILLEGPCPSGR